MATFTNTPKNSATFTDTSKNAISPTTNNKSIHPWKYNEAGFTYNQVTDSVTGLPVYYNKIGKETFNNLTKN